MPVLLLAFWAMSLTRLDRFPPLHVDEVSILAPGYKLMTEGRYGLDMYAGFHRQEEIYLEVMPLMPLSQGIGERLFGLGVWPMRFLAVAWGMLILTLFGAMVAAYTLRSLVPMELRPVPAPFRWIPFQALLEGSMEANVRSLASLTFAFGAMVWLVERAGGRVVGTAVTLAIWVGLIEVAQRWIVGRTPDITPSLLLIALALVFVRLREVELLHDVHERVQPMDVINMIRKLEAFRPYFIEDPFSPENMEWFKQLRISTSVPIAMGELFNNINEFKLPMVNQWFDYIRVHVSQIGGISPAMKIARLGEYFNIKTAFHGPGDVSPVGHAAHAHIDMAIWNFGIQEAVHLSDPCVSG
jgi:hypothetical protein